jgi:amino acid transporter
VVSSAEMHKPVKPLGLWRLAGAAFGGVIGSGWLLTAGSVATIAGPAAVLTWVVGGALLLCVALVMIQVSRLKNTSGGLVWWPVHSSGRVVGTVVAAAVWIVYAANPPSEALAMAQYTSPKISGLYDTHSASLTARGYLFAWAVLLVLCGINLLGVTWFARINTVVTAAKFVVPVVTVILILLSSWSTHNFSAHGGVAPYGYGSALTAITGGGVVYAYTGFQGPFDLGGEADRPTRNLGRSVLLSLILAIVVYTALQIAFVGALPSVAFGKGGWSNLGAFASTPYLTLALFLNLTWFSWVLTADALFSPAGSALVFTSAMAHEVESLALNNLLPDWFHRRFGPRHVLRNALICNLVIGTVLLGFGSWNKIVSSVSMLALFAYAASAIAHVVFTRVKGDRLGLAWRVLSPATFVFATEIVYWARWPLVWRNFALLFGLSMVLHAYRWRFKAGTRLKLRHELRSAAWLPVYFGSLLLLSGIGSFGGLNLLTRPWDSLVAGGVGLACFHWAVRLSTAYVREHPPSLD